MSYICNCGQEFEHHQQRTMHMGTCPVMTPPRVSALGPLEFKAKDSTDPDFDSQPKITIREANRLLAERLGETVVVYSHKPDGIRWDFWDPHREKLDTHRARLVCIEKLEGK